eukprot:scaffold154979_cov54-Attheya_sp.AAC.2
MTSCPLDPRNLVRSLLSGDFVTMSELPWTPFYTQAAASGKAVENTDSLLAYWAVAATVAFTVIVYAFENYLDARQKKSYHVTTFPKELETTVSVIDAEPPKQKKEEEAKTDEAKEGGEAKKPEIDQYKPLLPQLQEKFTKSQAHDHGPSVRAGKITARKCAKIEKKHGFNKQTLGLFVSDKLKGLALTAVIGGPFVALLLKIIKVGGEYFFVYVWGFLFVFSLFMMTVYPVVIMPLFNKYEPLSDGELKTRIYGLADKLKYPLTKLFVMDGSKRSSHSNAFMFGFGKNKRIGTTESHRGICTCLSLALLLIFFLLKQLVVMLAIDLIVLFDTLMQQVHDDEILAILGHELGHWSLGHTLTNFVVTQMYTGASFYAFSLCYGSNDLYRAFGFDGEGREVPTIIALMLFFQTLWAPIDKILSFALTMFSRRCEFEADRFSVGLGMSKALQSGLCKIHLENLGALCPDGWYSTYHYSHPPLVERLSAMMKLDKKTE